MKHPILQWLIAFALLSGSLVVAAERSVADLTARAQKGNAAAQYELGVKYAQGDGVPKDSSEAVKWYRKAGEQGFIKAQWILGFMYANGKGVAKDATEGLAWVNIAAESGMEHIVKHRDNLERQLGTEVTLAAQERSKQILRKIEASKRAPNASKPKD